jgi:hypothetical protein
VLGWDLAPSLHHALRVGVFTLVCGVSTERAIGALAVAPPIDLQGVSYPLFLLAQSQFLQVVSSLSLSHEGVWSLNAINLSNAGPYLGLGKTVLGSLDVGLDLPPSDVQRQPPTGELVLELVEAISLLIEVLLGCGGLLEAVDFGKHSKVAEEFCPSKVGLVEEGGGGENIKLHLVDHPWEGTLTRGGV